MIAILLSTYNGELYLKEQIESLLNQTFQDWCLFIRDDGSKDKTLDIINQYITLYPDKICLIKDCLGNLGPGSSFMQLLSIIESDYYMFCDQDDVWLPNKIEKSIREMKKVENENINSSIAIFTDLYITDNNLNIISDSMWKYSGLDPNNAYNFYKNIAFGSPSYGCTMIINNFSKQLLYPYKKWKFHDHWIILIISHFGTVSFINEPTIYYRQHSNNVTGCKKHSIISSFKLLLNPRHTLILKIKYYKHLKLLPFNFSLSTIFKYKIKKWSIMILNTIK